MAGRRPPHPHARSRPARRPADDPVRARGGGDCQPGARHRRPRGAPRPLPTGVYGVSNADLDSPWPKLLRARHGLQQALPAGDDEALFALLADPQRAADSELPETGVGLEIERLLSSVFIASPGYGTRASTLVKVHADGSRQIRERRFGPDGVRLGDVSLLLEPPSAA